jgi:serine/threonine-protein kinase HipA
MMHYDVMFCTIQINHSGQWLAIARFTPYPDKLTLGYAGCGGVLEYDAQYVTDFLMGGDKLPFPRVSLPFPIDFLAVRHDRWPAFLLDLVPTGAGRRDWLDRLGLKENPRADWTLLTSGARHPVGWLRVVPGDGEQEQLDTGNSVGFTKTDVAAREQDFLEYMIEQGASVAGSSDVQGESPKLLLTEDQDGLLHADGALADSHAQKHWLVKFARRSTSLERQILRNEYAYLRLADAFQTNVHGVEGVELIDGKALFIPRFDRCRAESGVLRFGLESFASAAGVAEFGVRAHHEEHCRLIASYSASPAEDMLEYLRRDILNICMGNTDNHARNHAFIKKGAVVRLSPLYDFAPMFLSDEGYARVVRWEKDKERLGQPDWSAVGTSVAAMDKGPKPEQVAALLDSMAKSLSNIDTIAKESGIDDEVIERRRMTVNENIQLLKKAADKV